MELSLRVYDSATDPADIFLDVEEEQQADEPDSQSNTVLITGNYNMCSNNKLVTNRLLQVEPVSNTAINCLLLPNNTLSIAIFVC